jgi:ADP-heptose:LPS heptosyltransferase
MDAHWPDDPPAPDFAHLLSQSVKTGSGRKRVVVHAGANKIFKQWPRDRFESVAVALSRDFEVVWIDHGSTTGPAPKGTIPALVSTLGELATRLAGANLFLGNNSGPMHMANALGCPGVVVTGPSAFGWDPYWHPERWTVLRHPNLYCAPCEKANKDLGICTNTASPMACMDYWTDERVEAVCRLQLNCDMKPGL